MLYRWYPSDCPAPDSTLEPGKGSADDPARFAPAQWENLKMKVLCTCVTLWALAGMAGGQTKVDLRTETKSVDFSAATATRPLQTGTLLPSTCLIGELFYKTNGTPGSNIYGCTATDNWTVQASGLVGAAGPRGATGLAGPTGSIGAKGDTGNAGVTGATGSAGATGLPGADGATGSPGATGSTGSLGPAGAPGVIGDFNVARTSATVLTIGTTCSLQSPCNVRLGSVSYSYTAPAIAVAQGGTGSIYIYITSSGVITAGHNISVSCTATCVAQSGVTAFPFDSVPLFTWSVTAGSLDVNGGQDFRAFVNSLNIVSGAGLLSVNSGSASVFAVDASVVSMRNVTPATSADSCAPNDWATDGSFYYLCVAANTWKRTALTSW